MMCSYLVRLLPKGSGLYRFGLAAALGLGLSLAAPLAVPFVAAPAFAEDAAQAVDYPAWEAAAALAEAKMAEADLSDNELEAQRAILAEWRDRLSSAQSANGDRIVTVKEQIAALGAAPAEGASEAPEIASKRAELSDLLGQLQAPGIAADEAYRRADGLIREIDTTLRDRHADQLLKLSPSPLNPANWPAAAIALSDVVVTLWDEADKGWNNSRARATLMQNLPLILLLLALAVMATVIARRWIESIVDRIQGASSEARVRVMGFVASLGQIVVPTAGMIALSSAALMTGMLGPLGTALAQSLPILGAAIFGAIWLGGRVFPRHDNEAAILALPPERRIEGRFEAAMMGLVLAAEMIRAITMDHIGASDAAVSVASFPILLAGAFLLWRIGQILRQSTVITPEAQNLEGGPVSNTTFIQTILSLVSRACSFVAWVGPALACFGYVEAAKALIFPALLTLTLFALLVIVQTLLTDLWAMLTRADQTSEREGLVPVLLGFVLTLAAVPLLALIWGARVADLSEVWTRFREGFLLGETRISPTDFLVFLLLFGFGYLVTRLFQGALRSTILPRTKMERGGQNALVAGAGYLGIFISALIAINATGIDLSGLAIVASALSVGIGFGLQNIVQNFVSGVILMIERPVSEGDWINVGGTEGIVKTISVRSTRIQTFDRSMVVVPNADLVSQRVTNWTRFSLAGRLIVPVVVAWGQDPKRIEAILREVAEAQPMVVLNPPPAILLQSFGAGVLNFEIRVILRDVNFSSQVKHDINAELVRRFMEDEVVLPPGAGQITLGVSKSVMAEQLRVGEDLPKAVGVGNEGGKAKPKAPPPLGDETT